MYSWHEWYFRLQGSSSHAPHAVVEVESDEFEEMEGYGPGTLALLVVLHRSSS
jgi:hypothetical protein